MIPTIGSDIDGPSGERSLRLERHIGAGAFGIVFRALDLTSDIAYAVKFPQAFFFGSQEDLTAFRNEVIAAQRIQHPNVVRVLHIHTDEANIPPYLVMEFMQDGTLEDALDRFRTKQTDVPAQLVALWSDELIRGIAAINAEMLHRDLKPDNIFVDANHLKIGDFGLSKIIHAATRSKSFKGRQHVLYMAPEAWRLEQNCIQLDMYAAGIVLYQIASLHYPYELPPDLFDFDACREMHFYQQHTPVCDRRSDLPVSFSHFIARLLEKNPDDRFPDWHTATIALEEAWESAAPPEAESPPALESLLSETQRVHDLHARRRLQEERHRQQVIERRKLDDFQALQILETITETVRAFNAKSALGQIEQDWRVQTHTFRLPYGGRVRLTFSTIEPPLLLRSGTVRFCALLTNSRGVGLNYLLRRTSDQDLYGHWIVCRARLSGFADPRRVPPRPYPFGFDFDEIAEIARSDGGSHIYEVELNDGIADAFLQIVLDAMEAARPDGPG